MPKIVVVRPVRSIRHSAREILEISVLGPCMSSLAVLERRANVVWDLTPDMLTELSEGTLQTLGGLEETVSIHLVFKSETESTLRWMLETLASSYARNGQVAVDVIDPVTEPGRIRSYAESGRSLADAKHTVHSLIQIFFCAHFYFLLKMIFFIQNAGICYVMRPVNRHSRTGPERCPAAGSQR